MSTIKEYKVFVGGLTVETIEQDLEEYFSSFGNISQVCIIKNKSTGLSKCYGFVHTIDVRTYNRIIESKHTLNDRILDCKDGFNKEDNPQLIEQLNKKKIFVGGLSLCTTDNDLLKYFESFGDVFKAYVIFDPKTKRSKRFGFVIMKDQSSVDKILDVQEHSVKETTINCKRFDKSTAGNPSHGVSNPDEGKELASPQEEATNVRVAVTSGVKLSGDAGVNGCTREVIKKDGEKIKDSKNVKQEDYAIWNPVTTVMKKYNSKVLKKKKRVYLLYNPTITNETLIKNTTTSSLQTKQEARNYEPITKSKRDFYLNEPSKQDGKTAQYKFNICMNIAVYNKINRRYNESQKEAPVNN